MKLEDVLRKNLYLKNIHAGKRCFIIGNGPSIKMQNLCLLRDEIAIVVNSFYLHPDANTVNPDFWMLANPSYWEKPEIMLSDFQSAVEKNACPKLFVPTGGFVVFTRLEIPPLMDLHFYRFDGSWGIDTIIDFSRGIPPYGQNVVIVSLMLAFYLGCNPIYLIGCDHEYLKVKKEEYEDFFHGHFYPEPERGKFGLMSDYYTWEIYSELMATTKYQYGQLKRYASKQGFLVYNATKGGYLDIFPRVQFESLFPIMPLEEGIMRITEHDSFNSFLLGKAAIKLLNDGDNHSALVLIEEALRCNINRRNRVEGLEYLKAICLARLKRYGESLVFACQDHECNTSNRDNSSLLIKQLQTISELPLM